MPKAKRKLKNLIIHEGSLVDRGANPHAHVRLFKMEQDMDKGGFIERLKSWAGINKARTTGELVSQADFYREFGKLRSAFQMSVAEILDEEDGDAQTSMLQRSLEEFTERANELQEKRGGKDEALMKCLGVLTELSEKGNFAEAERVRLAKVVEEIEGLGPTEEEVDNSEVSMTKEVTFEGVLADLDDAQKSAFIEAAKQHLTKNEEKENVDKTEVPESVRKRLEDAEAVAKKATEDLAQLQAENERAQYIAKAKELHVGVDTEELGDAFYQIAKADKSAFEKVEKAFRAASEQLAKNSVITEELGSEGEGKDLGAKDKLDEIAKEIMKSNDKLSSYDAWIEAGRRNPDLYEQVRG